MKTIGMVLILCAALAQVSCEKTESDNLARAQKCLDEVSESDPTKAKECFTYIEKYTSQQADILKCSILITSGGLMENKIVKAYNVLKDDSQGSKSASFMSVLSLDLPDIDTGYETAVKANGYCVSSGVPGLKYLSGIIVAGTTLAKMMSHLGITTNIDVNDPAAVNTAVQNLLTQCTGATPPADCTTDLAQMGSTVTGLASSYCATDSADDGVCGQINSAVTAANGDETAVGEALLCYMNNKTYDPTASPKCH